MLLTITNSIRYTAATLVLVSACAAGAQQYVPPPPALKVGPCVPTKEFPCTPPPATAAPPTAADKFAFPGDTEVPANAVKTPADSKAFPFPDEAEKPAAPATAPDSKAFPFPSDPESSSSSSAPSAAPADPDSGQPELADKGSSGSTRMERNRQRRLLPKVEDLDEREARDLEVAHYYTTTGNFLAAYMRAKDAVATIPDDPLAHFALAEGAHALKKNDEAVAEYQAYLKLDPDGDKVKDAKRALAEIGKK